MKNTEALGYLTEKRRNSCGICFSAHILPLSINNEQENNAENSCAHVSTTDKRMEDAAVFLM